MVSSFEIVFYFACWEDPTNKLLGLALTLCSVTWDLGSVGGLILYKGLNLGQSHLKQMSYPLNYYCFSPIRLYISFSLLTKQNVTNVFMQNQKIYLCF